MSKQQQEFVPGLFVRHPHKNAPDFVWAQISIKKADMLAWLANAPANAEGWLEYKIDVKESREGKLYCAVNRYKAVTARPADQPDVEAANAANDAAAEDQAGEVPF